MSDKDGITGDVRSREEEYFRRKDRELVEKLRKASESGAARAALEASSGIHDPAMLQELEALGFTPATWTIGTMGSRLTVSGVNPSASSSCSIAGS